MSNKPKRCKRIVRYGNKAEGEVEEYLVPRAPRRWDGKILKRAEKQNLTPWDVAILNELNSEDNLRWLINSNFKQGDLHLSLTYRMNERPPVEISKKYVQKFLADLRRHYEKIQKPLKYIWTTEIGKKGAVHHHMILEYIDLRVLDKLWRWGKVIVNSRLDNSGRYDALAAYIIKETRRTFCMKNAPHKKRYNTSKNLTRPDVTYEKIKAKPWKQPPHPNKRYYIIPGSLIEGIHGRTGAPWRFYKIVFLE